MKIFNASNLTFEALSTPINMTDNPTQKHDRHQYTAFLKLDTAQKKEEKVLDLFSERWQLTLFQIFVVVVDLDTAQCASIFNKTKQK